MSTTDLFVEIVVIGVGAAIWLTLLVFSVFGYDWVPLGNVFSLTALIPVLAIVYVLGIVVDRIADRIFDIWKPSIQVKEYDQPGQDFDDRRLIYIHPGRLANLLEYGRSRLRICRGWTINAGLILLSLNIFVWTRLTDHSLKLKVSIFGSVALILFAYATAYSWYQLTWTDYKKVKRQSKYLRSLESNKQEE